MNSVENPIPNDYSDKPEPAPAWRRAFEAIASQLRVPGLQALRRAVANDDPRLLQGATTAPPPLQCLADCHVEAACAVAYAAWRGESLDTVAEVEEAFARILFAADTQLGEPGGTRHFLNQFDEWSRKEIQRHLLPAIDAVLAERGRELGTEGEARMRQEGGAA